MAQLEKIVAAYRLATQYPALISARILDCSKPSSVSVQSVWTQRVLERQMMTRFRQTALSDYKTYNITSPPTDITNELISTYSKSSKYFCVIRELGSGKESKQYLEVWADYSLVKNYDLSAFDLHGKVYADAEFGTLEWSPDETKIIYIAEKKVPKSKPFYKQHPKSSIDENEEECNNCVPGKEYEWSQDWGEQLVGIITPVLVVCDIQTDTIDILSNIPNDINPASATWTPDGNGVVAIGYKTTPRKLGLIYCTNRPSHIFSLTLDGQYTVLSSNSEQLSVKSPRFNSNGTKLVWLERLAGGPHHSCFKLISCNWSTKKITTVVDFVNEEIQIKSKIPFYGLYNQAIIKRSWLNDNKTLILSTPQGGSIHTIAIDTESKDIYYLPVAKPFHESVSVIDVCNDVLVLYKSSLNKPGQLFIMKINSVNEEYDFNNICINEISPSRSLPNSDTFVVEHGYTLYDKPTTIFYGPKDSKCPLIVWPHGGPHSSSLDSYIADAAFFVQIGFAVLFINYRGSTCLGKYYVESLLGNIGDADVKDVYNAVHSNPSWSNRKLVLFGGSHGGFIVTQLSGQYPNEFKAISTRNPAVDLLTLFCISDIPDWALCEAGYNYSYVDTLANSKEIILKLADCSPSKHAHKVKAPTLLLLGEKDLRVPPSQGLSYYHLLKKYGVTTKVMMYNDCHSLATVAANMDSSINSALWFIKYTSDDSE